MIRAITEMRNAVEYEAKTLSEAESIAADANWRAERRLEEALQ